MNISIDPQHQEWLRVMAKMDGRSCSNWIENKIAQIAKGKGLARTLCTLGLGLGLLHADGASVTLGWEPSPDSIVAAYRLYWGTEPNQYRIPFIRCGKFVWFDSPAVREALATRGEGKGRCEMRMRRSKAASPRPSATPKRGHSLLTTAAGLRLRLLVRVCASTSTSSRTLSLLPQAKTNFAVTSGGKNQKNKHIMDAAPQRATRRADARTHNNNNNATGGCQRPADDMSTCATSWIGGSDNE